MIPVVKPYFPEIENYIKKLNQIWQLKTLTNNGPFVQELESKIRKFTGVKNVMLTCNGTIPIMAALNTLGMKGEIITTPFSYIATTSSILWENCKPIFVDIDPESLNIDEKLIEIKITSKTTCILATHTYGNPCNVEVIERIAKKNNLKVIYDAAHCFGSKYKGKSLFKYGDVSTTSFHATKIMSTGEGGAVFANDHNIAKLLKEKLNFGHNGPNEFSGVGINGKMSELNAAFGLCVFDNIDKILKNREFIVNHYNKNLNFKNFKTIKIRKDTSWNYSYYPIIFNSSLELEKYLNILQNNQIYPRRYFYPSLNTLSFVSQKQACPISEDISSRVLCLPIYDELNINDLKFVCTLINNIG
jgi:dTDP-4-amino-4,6-dideoxygalactose transaminase